LFSKKNNAKLFVDGAREGAECCFNLLPTLLLVMCGVSALFSSGSVDLLCSIFSPIMSVFGLDTRLLPAIVLRPFSGSAVTAVADRLIRDSGADSNVTKTACLLMGSTDTIIYTLSIYFSSVNIKRTRYALPASFIVLLFSVLFCNLVGKIML
jgi:spore maturation protein B